MTGEDNPAGRSHSVQAQEAPGFRHGSNLRPEDNLWPIIHCLSELLPLLLHEAEPPGEDCSEFEQKHLAGLGQDHRFSVFSVISDQEAPEPCQHRGLFSWCFIVTPVKPHEGPPTFEPENSGLAENIQGAAKRIFRRGVQERELWERVNPVPPYHLHDDFRGFCHAVTTNGLEQHLEGNPTNPQKSDQSLPEFFIHFLPSTYHFITSFSTSVVPSPKTLSLIFLGRPCCDKAQQNGRKNERKERR